MSSPRVIHLCVFALLALFVLTLAHAQESQDLHLQTDAEYADSDSVFVELDDSAEQDDNSLIESESQSEAGTEAESLSSLFSSWSSLSSPPADVLSAQQEVELLKEENPSLAATLFEQESSLEQGPLNDLAPGGEVPAVGEFSASVPEGFEQDHALIESAAAASLRPGLYKPSPNFDRSPEYTVSFELFIPRLRGNWANIFSRGASDNDRTPGFWVYPGGSRIHWRHASTRSWNDGCDSTVSAPVGRWFPVKAVMKKNKAFIYIDGQFDNICDLGKNHRFTWGQKSLRITSNGELNSYYQNDMQVRNWQWSNIADDLPAEIPSPNFDAPVKYTVEFDWFQDKPYNAGHRNLFNRGRDNSDRTPGMWTYPGSNRLHFRHATNRNWNYDLDISFSPSYNQWHSFKGVVNHNKAWMYVDGVLDRIVDLSSTGEIFVWGAKSLGFLKGPAVHPGYAPSQMRNFKWTNDAEVFPGPQIDFTKPTQFSVSFDLKVPAGRRSHWPALWVRGRDNGDRVPGLWVMPNNRIHIRTASTQGWNTDIDTVRKCPENTWFNVKLVVDRNQAFVFVDGQLDRFVDLGPHHKFLWGAKRLSFSRGATVHPAHHNDGATRIKMRNFKWSNAAEKTPLALPKPNFSGPVDYTLSLEALIKNRQPNWACLMNRGRDNSDRTPGIWTFPGSTRIHIRHASTRSTNEDVDTRASAPIGKWFSLKTVFNHNKASVYLDGILDREVNLGKDHFTWGKKSLGWAHGWAVHPSYHDVEIRNLQFLPNTTLVADASPLETPDAAFWGARLKPTDQTPPAPLPPFKALAKAPKLKPAKKPKVAVPKRKKPSQLPPLAIGETPKTPRSKAPKPLPVKPKVTPKPKTLPVNPMTGKLEKKKAPAVVVIPKKLQKQAQKFEAKVNATANADKPVVQAEQAAPKLAAKSSKKKAAAAEAEPKASASKAKGAAPSDATESDRDRRRRLKAAEEEARIARLKRQAAEDNKVSAQKQAAKFARSQSSKLARLDEEEREDKERAERRRKLRQQWKRDDEDWARITGKKSSRSRSRRTSDEDDSSSKKGKSLKAKSSRSSSSSSNQDSQPKALPASAPRFENGVWHGAGAQGKHTDKEGRLCPDCQPIIYNTDSPLSDDDVKQLRAQHESLVVDNDVKLHAQHVLDNAQLMVWKADSDKQKILDKYPAIGGDY